MDLQQLAFVRRPGHTGHTDTDLGIANVATLHRLFAARGAQEIIVAGHLATRADRGALRRSTPDSHVTFVRLHADATTITAHVRDRAAGGAARLAGDDLLGASSTRQAAVLSAAVAEQHLLAALTEDVVVDVTGCSIDEVVSQVREVTSAPRGDRHDGRLDLE
jgi:hypothetical protein